MINFYRGFSYRRDVSLRSATWLVGLLHNTKLSQTSKTQPPRSSTCVLGVTRAEVKGAARFSSGFCGRLYTFLLLKLGLFHFLRFLSNGVNKQNQVIGILNVISSQVCVCVFVYRGCGQSSHLYSCEITTERMHVFIDHYFQVGAGVTSSFTHIVGGSGATSSRICMYIGNRGRSNQNPKIDMAN